MLKGKVVVVTGAGGGIGRDFALLFAAHGASVVVNDLGTSVAGEGASAGPAQKVVDEITAAGGKAVASTDSVADWEAANRIVKTAIDAFGRIDCVVNNAGILRDRFFFNMSIEEWKAVIDVHLNGSFYVSRAAAPYFKSQNTGSYVFMTSTSGLIGNLGQANYSAAKAGLVGLTKTLAREWGPFKVNVNAVAFGFVETRLTAASDDGGESFVKDGVEIPLGIPERMRQMAPIIIPLGRPATPDDAAGPIFFLCSPWSNFVHGQVLNITGGQFTGMTT
jgi:3-oxoacyl-[acyl-carrier protein] reductase